MGKVVRYIYTGYCFIPFLLSFFLIIPVYFVIFNFWPKNSAQHTAHKVSRFWASLLFFFFFMRVEIKNQHLIDSDKTYIFIANHLSMLDIPLYARSCVNTFRFLAKAELTKIPLLGYIINNLYISVKRTEKTDRVKSIEKMLLTLKEGISVFIAPEGTRNKTSKSLLDFHDGAFRLAIAAQQPLAILTILNTHHHLSPANILQMKPGILKAVWSQPIETVGMTELDITCLKELARNKMLVILEKDQ